MPLMQSASRQAFQDNLRAELAANKPKAQALAIAYSVQRRNRADGGSAKDDKRYSKLPASENIDDRRNESKDWGWSTRRVLPEGAKLNLENPHANQSVFKNQVRRSGPGHGLSDIELYAQYLEQKREKRINDLWSRGIDRLMPTKEMSDSLKRFPGFEDRWTGVETKDDPIGRDILLNSFQKNTGSDLPSAPLPRPRPRAAGGMTGPDFNARSATSRLARAGLIHSPVAGRTDRIPMTVPAGSYVFPADHVSHLGQGNSLSGGQILDRMFNTHIRPHRPNIPRPPKLAGQFAFGGFADGGESHGVPIVVAGGEYLLHPDQIAEIGGGDIDKGHDALDHWVTTTRKEHVKTLNKLPPPRRD